MPRAMFVTRSYTTTGCPPRVRHPIRVQAMRCSTSIADASGTSPMKIVLWIIFIIFLIGLAVVLGLGKLIF